jgi:hypothetical protein
MAGPDILERRVRRQRQRRATGQLDRARWNDAPSEAPQILSLED